MDERNGLALDFVELEGRSLEELLYLAEGTEVLGVPYDLLYLLPLPFADLLKLLPFPLRLSLAYLRKGLEEGVLKIDRKGVVHATKRPRFIEVSSSDVERAVREVPKCFRKVFLGKEEFYQVKAEDPESFGQKALSDYLPSFLGVIRKFLAEDFNYLFVGDGGCHAYVFDALSKGRLRERMTIADIDEEVVRAYRELGFKAQVFDLRFLKDFVLPSPYHFIYTYHIEFYQTDAVLSFVRANLLPYGTWVSYVTPAESERRWVYDLLRYIEMNGFLITNLSGKYFRAINIPEPERRLLWREG